MADTNPFETRTLEQMARATAVSPNALTGVQEPGGGMASIEVRRLFGKLLHVDTAHLTDAALQADLDHPEFACGFVYADPDPGKNGWSRKVGAEGAGNWVQFERLSSSVIAEMEGIAADVFTAAASVYVTSYGHEFSEGNRLASLLAGGGYIRTDLNVAGGSISNLINGATGSNNADGVNFGPGQDVAGKAIWEIGFPVPRALLLEEWQMLFSTAADWGSSELQLRRADGSWIAASAVAATGGATTVTRTAISPDKAGYLGARQYGTAGTTAAGYALELRMKLGNGVVDGEARVPLTLAAGQVPAAGPFPGQLVAAEPIDYNAVSRIVGRENFLCEYMFDEGTGEVARDRSGNGRDIVFDAAWRAIHGGELGVNYVWTRRGLMLRNAQIQTALLPNTRTVIAVYVPLREDGTAVQWNISPNTAIGSNHAHMGGLGHTQNTQTVHTGNGGEDVVPLWRDGNGNASLPLSRGGPVMVFSESSVAITGNLGLGGMANRTDYSNAGGLTRSTEMTCVYFAVLSTSLAGDQRTAVRTALRKASAPRGVFFDWRDCSSYEAGTFNIGQSNAGNESIKPADLSAGTALALALTPSTSILSAGRRSDAAPMARPAEYRVGFNGYPGFRVAAVGFEAGMALAHEKANGTVRRTLCIVKVAPGSSNVGNAGGGALDWRGPPGGSLLGWAMRSWRDAEQDRLNQGVGLRLFAVNVQNGENDCNNTAAASGNIAAYRAAMQTDIWGKIKEQLPFAGMRMVIGQIPPWEVGQNNYTEANVNAMRAEQAGLVADNPGEMFLVPSGPGIKQADRVHITAEKSVERGETGFYPLQGIV